MNCVFVRTPCTPPQPASQKPHRKLAYRIAMLLQSHASMALALAMAVVVPNNLHAERQMEKLGRGVVALVKTDGTIYVGWRLLGTDPENIGFNLYRTANSGTPIQLTTNQTVTTDFVDATAKLSQTNRYFVRPVIGGVLGAASGSFTVPANAPVHDSYLSIPLTFDPGDQVIQDQGQNMYVEVGDFDGDGEYEYLLKWANNPYTDVGDPVACTDTYKLDAYKLDGTRLWRVNLGWNLMCGPEFSPTVVCDLDGDGIAEIITKTAEGTTDGTGITIGDTDGDGITDYRPTSGSPVITNGPEFLSVFSGATGKELARVPWIARGNLADWGDATGNRGNRNNMTVAWLDGHGPSIVMCRGIYARMKMEAWNFRNGQLTNLWKWDSATDPLYQQWQTEQGVTEGKGSHMIRSGDVDGDGRDEVLRGSLTMGPDGVPLYTKPTGHGDEMRFGDLDPDRPGLEVWMGYENPPNPINGMQLYDAATGDPVWGIITGTSVGGDAGKSLAAPFDPDARGFQFWGWDGTYDRDGKLLTTAQPGTRHEVWWDGQLTRNLVDEARVYTWNLATHVTSNVFSGDGYGYAGTADALGDWREEIISPRPTELRIYSTTFSASNRLYTLMHDPVYRLSAAVQAQRKVPTSTPGFYLGPGMLNQPIAPVSDADIVWTGGGSNVWDAGTTTNWHVNWYWSTNRAATTFASGQTVLFDLAGTSTNPVVLSDALAPASVLVNAGNEYVFSGTGSLAGAMTLTKAGRGTLTICTTNSYSGATLVTAGSLLVNGELNQSPVTVRGGSPWGPTEVGGRGTLGNGLTAEAGGGVSPGQGIGSADTLHVANGLVLAGGTINLLDLSDDPTGTSKTNDLVEVAGDLTLLGTNMIAVNPINGTLSPGTYPLVTYSGTLNGGVSNLVVTGAVGVPFVLTNSPGQIALLVRSTRAATIGLTWLGGQGNQWDLATTTNWLNGATPDSFVTGDSVRFDSVGAGNPSVTLNDSMLIGGMVVDATSDYTITGLGGIGGVGSIVKTNTGKLSLLTDNTYTGKTILNGGVLEVARLAETGKPNPLGMSSANPTNLVLYGNSTLRLTGLSTVYTDRGATFSNGVCTVEIANGSTDLSLYGSLVGDGTLRKSGSGTMNISGSNSFTGGTIISGGTLNVTKQSSLGSSTGTLTFTNGGTLGGTPGTFTRPIVLQAGGGVFNFGSSIPTLISGPGGFSLVSGGQLTISGANTYSGGTAISDGLIWVTVPGALGTGGVTVSDGGSLVIRPGATQFTNSVTIAGNGLLGYSGSIFLSGADGTFSGSVTLSANATIACANTAGLDLNLNGPVNLGSRTLSLLPGVVDSSKVVKWGIGGIVSGTGNLVWDTLAPSSTLTLKGANTFSGQTTVQDVCALVVSNTLALQNSTLNYINGAVLFGNGITGFTIGALTGNRNLALTNAGGAAVTVSVGNNNRDALYSGYMSQSGGLNKVGSGKWTLSGTNVYSGATVVSSGTLELTGWLTNQNTLTVSGGATLQLSGGTLGVAATTIAANGLLTGYGTINGSLLNNGLVVVNGSLTINGGVTNNGTISVPAGSTITFNGPVVNNGVVDASAGGIVIANSTWTGNPYVGVPPGASYTNTMTGNWSVVAWQPTQPLSGIRTTNVFNNSATVSSTNDLGVFNLNQLRFDNQAVTLRGDALQFGGDAPSLVTAQNYAHTVANTLTLNEDTRVQISANTTTISGAIGGAGELVKSGAGVLALSASNSYSGGTLIADGVLAITSDNQLGAPGNDLSFTNGGTLRVTTGTITLNNRLVSLKSGGGVISNTSALTVSNSISGPGSLTKTGSGRLTLNAANSYAGGSLLNQGELYYVKSGGLGSGDVTLLSGAQFTFRPGGSTLANNITFAGTGISSRGALRLESVAVTLNGDLSLDNDAKIASDGSSSDTLTANGDVALGASTLTLAPGFATPSIIWTFNGVISGSGGLAITAPVLTSGFFRVTLANANTYSGDTTITAPASATGGTRLGLNHVNAIQNSTYDTGAAAANVTTLFLIAGNNTYNFGGLKGANDLAVSGNTLNIGGNNASTIYSGAITGNGGLIKSGSGTLTLSGANAYSGGTLVSNGVLKVDASGAIGTGDLSIASGATCGIGNSAAMAASAAVYLSGVLDLTNGVNLTVQRLYINGQLQSAGNWNAARDPVHFSGSGNLTVTDGLPAAPSALAATSISSSQINLSWIDNADNEGGFEIQRSLTSGSGYVQIATVGANAAAYSDTGLNAETLYFYRVRATNYFAGSDFSAESSATTLPNPPSAPTGLAAVGGAGKIDLSWAAAAGASSYKVKRGASSGGPYTFVVSNVNTTAYSDANVANGTTYYYVVSGVNAGGEGGNSAEVSAMPSSAGSYTNISNGAWSTVVWQPMMTAPGLQTTNVFRNSAAVSSTNDLGDFTLNQLRFDDQAVALSGDPLTFDGVGPALIAAPDEAHSIANDLNLNQDTRFSIAQNTTTINGAINGVGALVKSGAGALNLTASNSYSGGTVIADGVLGITSDNQLGLAGSAVTFTNGGRLRITSSSVTLNNRALELQSGGGGISNTIAVTLNAAVSGPGSLTKTGAGKLTLSAASTYSGGTTIGSGTLYVTGGSVLGTGPVTIQTGGMLEHNASGTLANDLTLSTSNVSRGLGGITISGSSTRTFSGDVTLGANANISGGNTANAVTWSGAFDLGAFTLTVNPNCATAVQSWAIDGVVTGTGGLALAAPGLTSGTLTLRLGGANSYSGETLLSAQSGATGAARLALANVAALQNSTLNTGLAGGAQEVTFTVSGFNTYALGGLTGADALDLGGNSIDVGANGSTTTYSGEISGAGGFTKSGAGTLTLSGVNTFSGGTLVSDGTLLVDATGALGSGDLTVSAGANCTIQNGTALATNATISLVGVMTVDNGVALTVRKLYLNGQLQSPGVWNAARDATHFAGGGNLIVTDGLPAVPNGLSATAGDAQVALNWSAAAGAVSYNVKRSTANGGPYTTIANVTNSAFTDTGLANGTDYYYVVSGSNANGESANSAQVVATPIAPPIAPIGVLAEAGDAEVTLSWNTSSGATSYNVKRSNQDGGPYTIITNVTGAGCVDAGLTNETEYFYVITAVNAAGESGNSAQVSATPTSLPSPWLSQDIGSTGATGSASYSNGVFTVKGAGALIGSRADAFRFVYQSSSGDCTNVVRVASVQNTASAARAGVMIRDSLNADAMEAGVWVTPGNGITFSWRKTTGGTTSSTSSSGKTAPYWVKLTRTGNSFRAYYSANGTSWTQFGSTQTISMGSAAYIGMGVTSGAAGTLCTSLIDNVATQP